MRLEELESFCSVVECGGFTRAARRLFLTQAAVSRHVRSLEQSLGVVLLVRSRGNLHLTEAGEVVYRDATELLDKAQAIRAEVGALKGLEGGRLSIAGGTVAGNYILPSVVSEFHRAYPLVRVDLRAVPAPVVFEQILQAQVDFGLTLGHDLPDGLDTRPAYEDDLLLVMSAHHPLVLQGGGYLPVAELARIPLVTVAGRRRQSRRLYEAWLRAAGVAPPSILEMNTYEQVKQVVGSGLGGAFLFPSTARAELQAGILQAVELDHAPPRGSFVFLFPPRRRLSPAASEFLHLLSRELPKRAGARAFSPSHAARSVVRS